jgi:UDP-N-acetylmuramate: L-alanyl-gamma-D-glutamyl-meso-diaminopimelate ligase
MWHYLPRTAVVTNVEFDHADIYRDERAYRYAFERFVNLVPRTGTLVLGWEGEVERNLAEWSWAPVESYGIVGAGASEAEDDGRQPRWRALQVEHGREGSAFRLVHDGHDQGRFRTPLVGGFNVKNCLAAVAAARAAGASWEGIRKGLETFESVRRRMEIRGEVRGIVVVDDFAHHPTAVRETILAARERFAGSRLIAIFEPRSYTAQRKEFQDAFQQALASADRVVIAGLFHPERYDASTAMDPAAVAQRLQRGGVRADYLPDVDDIVRTVVAEAKEGDVLLAMSNGGFGDIHDKLLSALENR